MRPLALALLAAFAGAAGTAAATPSLTLNGVPIDGVTSQRFENATVVIDEKGDVHIEAKGYAVRGGEAGSPADARPGAGTADRLTRRYFMVAEHAPGGSWDLAVFINSRWIREVRPVEGRVAMEITRFLRPGANSVLLAASRGEDGADHSSSPAALRVVMGEGAEQGEGVVIERPLVEMTRTAADARDRNDEFVLEAR
jgi:hypothetical protein